MTGQLPPDPTPPVTDAAGRTDSWRDAVALFEAAARRDQQAGAVIVGHCERPRDVLAMFTQLTELVLEAGPADQLARFTSDARRLPPPPRYGHRPRLP